MGRRRSANRKGGKKKSKRPKICEPFRFLDLPREIRDAVYEYVVGKHRSSQTLVFNALHSPLSQPYNDPDGYDVEMTDSFYAERWWPWPQRFVFQSNRRVGHKQKILPLLTTNRQIYSESKKILYLQNTFYVFMNAERRNFFQGPQRYDYDPGRSIPFGWDLSLITNLALHVHLHTHAEHGPWANVEFLMTDLWKLHSLQYLRMFISTQCEAARTVCRNITPSPFLIDENILTSGSYRKLMRTLHRSLPGRVIQIKFGLDNEEDKAFYFEADDLNPPARTHPDCGDWKIWKILPPYFVPAQIMQYTFEQVRRQAYPHEPDAHMEIWCDGKIVPRPRPLEKRVWTSEDWERYMMYGESESESD